MDDITALIGQMALNEDKIMLLYWEYAKAFPLFTKFWNKLAEEEKDHAHMLRGIAGLVDDKDTRAGMYAVTLGQVNGSINFIDAQINNVRAKKVKSDEAFDMALKIENSMLEDNVFSFFSSKDKKIQELFNRLQDDTKKHFNSLKRTIDSMK